VGVGGVGGTDTHRSGSDENDALLGSPPALPPAALLAVVGPILVVLALAVTAVGG